MRYYESVSEKISYEIFEKYFSRCEREEEDDEHEMKNDGIIAIDASGYIPQTRNTLHAATLPAPSSSHSIMQLFIHNYTRN